VALVVVVDDTAFVTGPAVILPSCRGRQLYIHFLNSILPHIRNPKVARLPVKAGAPRVPQPNRPVFVAVGAIAVGIAIARRNGVIARAIAETFGRASILSIHINTVEYPQQVGEGLGIIQWVTTGATISQGNVEIPIRPKLNVTSV